MPDDSYLADQLYELVAEREYMAEYVEHRKPYWRTLRHPRNGAMQWDLWNYAPLAHYDRAIEETRERLASEVRTDGGYSDLHDGTRKATVYYWLDPDTGAALEHTGVNDESTVPFFPDEEAAEAYLERRAGSEGDQQYEHLSLYKARTRKVGDAVDVLTDQSGIEDFVPDGGVQIDNPAPDRVWFWYDPAADHIVQEEVEPYDVRGVFETEDDAERFLDWYAEQYGIDDASHLELYSADLVYEGQSHTYLNEDLASDEEPPAQADLSLYQSGRG